jgi:hypothetical protein
MDSLTSFLLVFLLLVLLVLVLLGALWEPLNGLLNGTTSSQTGQPVRNSSPQIPRTTQTSRSRGPRTLKYHARSNRHIEADAYAFSFEEQSDRNWRVYILRQPGYGGRVEDAHTTHRLTDGNRRYICWSASIPTLEQAKRVAAMWADATEKYICEGARF